MDTKLTFQTHPLKAEIIKYWDDNRTNTFIHDWLKNEHPNVSLSLATLCKHFARYQYNKRHRESADIAAIAAKKKKDNQVPIEVLLWETVQQCRKKKKDKAISVKDWQYLDQQLQAAIEKLIRIQGSSGAERDVTSILSDIFAKFETSGEAEVEVTKPKEISEDEKLKIAQGVDDETKVETDIPSKVS